MSADIQAGPLPQASPSDEHHPGPLKRAGRLRSAARAWWLRRAERRAASADPGPIEPGPLLEAAPDGERHPGPLPKAERQRRARKTWREKRWERRRKRRFTEEVLGWVLVPLILIAGFWSVKAGLNALGTSPTALIQGLRAAVSSSGRP